MAISKTAFSKYIKSFQFRELFNDMGWNNDKTKQPIVIDDDVFHLTGIAEKSRFKIFSCEPEHGKAFPDKSLRKKIEGKVTKLFQEHLIIFIDSRRQEQIWQLAVRKAGSPTKINETRYHISQDPELLYQRAGGLFIPIEKEETITIVDVTKLVGVNFQQNNERVTKKFYESFKKEHTAFLKFIEGIDDKFNMDWYASLMLNRLMFCYFIQKKGFLDNNRDYLKDKLNACREKKGQNKFYSFYRDFLLVLFHKALGEPHKDLEVGIGKIPYLNGGLFDVHEIEKTYKNIQIDDKAFERLFDFFDEYEWHLDTRESASGKDINPDVIGYIFEKYINDRADMGAYYTKEDITDYISKNCVIPWLFDEVKRNYPKAFSDDGWLWQMVKASSDEYIYDAVKHGIPENGGLFDDLPQEVKSGFNTELEKKIVDGNRPYLWELRKEWNKTAPAEIALPTEIYREVIERRKRYADIKGKITNGEVKEINDFITYNLNIRQFAQDVIETTDDPEFIRPFYKALSSVTILDPTCGSGAFLFAAMNILEGLYETSIGRMQEFVNTATKGKYKFFEEVLNQVNSPEHPNLQYFIYKTIILNNLYGVDIMKEAVEIAKLRLFLKLVATVEPDYKKPNLGLEPLPDVDFNIRSGNTLIGYVTEKQLSESLEDDLLARSELSAIKEKCDIVGRAFARYKEIQLQSNADFEDFKMAKDDLNERLDKLRNELDKLLYKQHYDGMKYDQWLTSHQPFHWFAEFYEIIHNRGGFDVIIGNPPYVEYSKIRDVYKVNGYITEKCGNIYAYVLERCYLIKGKASFLGMIIPTSSLTTERMKVLQSMFLKYGLYHSTYGFRPAKLFEGATSANIHLSIILSSSSFKNINSLHHIKWNSTYREYLFQAIIPYAENTNKVASKFGKIPRLKSNLQYSIFNKISSNKPMNSYISISPHSVYYRTTGGLHFRVFTLFPTYSKKEAKYNYKSEEYSKIFFTAFVSNLWNIFYYTFSNCLDVAKFELEYFPFSVNELASTNKNDLIILSSRLNEDIKKNSLPTIRTYEEMGEIECYTIEMRQSKSIIDQIDSILAKHYGFSQEELDFIINYDIKYRMGKELDTREEGD